MDAAAATYSTAKSNIISKGFYKQIEAHEQTVLYEIAFGEQGEAAAGSVTVIRTEAKRQSWCFPLPIMHCFASRTHKGKTTPAGRFTTKLKLWLILS
jgi:hypothetical protein